MGKQIRIKKGLDIKPLGEARQVELPPVASSSYGVVPDHYTGLLPKLAVRVGDKVKAGSPVLFHKNFPEIKVASPVSGEVAAVNRGAKRKILSVEIRPDGLDEALEFPGVEGFEKKTREEILSLLLDSGMFALLRQRPYDYVPNPREVPRDVFVTANFTAPLCPGVDVLCGDRLTDVGLAIRALAKLTSGKVYVGVPAGSGLTFDDCETVELSGPHPAGNVGVLINHVKPVNKGETVWTAKASELAVMGAFLRSGKPAFSKRIALAGERLATTGLLECRAGANVLELLEAKLDEKPAHKRIIDGDLLTGARVAGDYRFLSPFSNLVTVINEGDDVHRMFGWMSPGFSELSHSRSFFSWLRPSKRYSLDARLQGGVRAMIMSGEYASVFPMDILPEWLMRAIITFDIDKMESLGIYEVAPEDFALCEFVDTSKMELQYFVRRALDRLYKELN